MTATAGHSKLSASSQAAHSLFDDACSMDAPLDLREARGTVAAGRSVRHQAARPIPRWWRDLCSASVWLLILVVVALWVSNGGVQDLFRLAPGLTSVGRLSGLVAAALLLVQVLLMSRIPLLEKTFGQDELARRHRWVGFTSFTLMMVHVVAITLGYAASSPAGLWATIVDLTLNYPGMLLAIGGTVALILVPMTSIRALRRRLRYESWHLLHLYAYLGVGLALPHQLWTGQEFLTSRVATVFWWGLWAGAAGCVVVWRLGLPIWRSLRHRLVVTEVRRESATVTTVTMSGRALDRLPVRAGQYFQWRFLNGPGATRGHPYSLSAAPDGRTLRITASHPGDGSAGIARLRPGTRVLIEGPYGRLHEGVRRRRKVLLMAAGIGITPMRSLLESMDSHPGELTLVYRARSADDLVLARELTALAQRRRARFFTVIGPRIPDRPSWLPRHVAHLDDVTALRELVPDLADHDVFVCGDPRWMAAVEHAARAGGVPREHLHVERFSY